MPIILFIIVTVVASLSAKEISYRQLLLSATANSYQLKIRKSDELIERMRLERLYADYYPNISLSYNSEYNKNLAGMTSGVESVGEDVISSTTHWQNSLSLNLNYELYNFGVREKNIGIAKEEVQVKKLLSCIEQKELFQNILERYSNASKAFMQKEMQKKLLEFRKELFFLKKRLYSAGQYSKIDLGDEAINIIDIERDLENSLMLYQENITELSKLSHVDIDMQRDQLLPITKNESLPKPIYDNSPLARKLKHQIKQKKEEIVMQRRSVLPTISLYSKYYLYGSDPKNLHDATASLESRSWNAGIALRLNLFEGFKYDADLKRLKYELKRLEEEKELSRREFDYRTDTTYFRLKHLNELEEKESALLKETNEKVTMMRRLRKEQQVDSTSALQANIEALQRKLNLELERIEISKEFALLEILQSGEEDCNQL